MKGVHQLADAGIQDEVEKPWRDDLLVSQAGLGPKASFWIPVIGVHQLADAGIQDEVEKPWRDDLLVSHAGLVQKQAFGFL